MYLNHKFRCTGNTSLFSYNSIYFKLPFHQVYQSEDSKKTETTVGVLGRRGFNTGNKMLITLRKDLGKQTIESDVSCELAIYNLYHVEICSFYT